MIGVAFSSNRKQIRLTAERWVHIVENHPELAGFSVDVLETIQSPDMLICGLAGELLAVKKRNHKYLVGIYKEEGDGGFVITAFLTSHIQTLKKKGVLWKA